MKQNYINTHEVAADIVSMFEDVLDKYGIEVPSPDDDDRDPDNTVGLYGTTYSDLLDRVEEEVIWLLAKHKPSTAIQSYVFSGRE